MERRLRICQHCGDEFPAASTGRPARYCGGTCRKRAHDQRRIDEAVAAAMAKAVAAERRRNRGNETKAAPESRGNETPVAGQRPGHWSMSALSMLPLWVDDDPQPDA
jgi:hypothetical protein